MACQHVDGLACYDVVSLIPKDQAGSGYITKTNRSMYICSALMAYTRNGNGQETPTAVASLKGKLKEAFRASESIF